MDRRTLLEALVGDGRFLLIFTSIILVLSGLLVIVQSLTGHFFTSRCILPGPGCSAAISLQ